MWVMQEYENIRNVVQIGAYHMRNVRNGVQIVEYVRNIVQTKKYHTHEMMMSYYLEYPTYALLMLMVFHRIRIAWYHYAYLYHSVLSSYHSYVMVGYILYWVL